MLKINESECFQSGSEEFDLKRPVFCTSLERHNVTEYTPTVEFRGEVLAYEPYFPGEFMYEEVESYRRYTNKNYFLWLNVRNWVR